MTEMFQVIYADPPWAYRNVRTGGSHRSGAAQKYPTLTPGQVAEIPVPTIVTPPATLWLWATVPLLPEILPVVTAWGFTYKTAIVWRKTGRRGMGYWLRGEVELLVFGTRGAVRAFRSSQPNILEAPVEAHSRKPAIFRQLIETYTPGQRRHELFAREARIPGWTCTGFDSDGRDLRTDIASCRVVIPAGD
jgi:N6-adenosine-specific RNA methylase IME4